MLDKSKLFTTALYYSIAEIVPRMLSFILLPILTRYLTPGEYGISSYTTAAMSFVFVLASLSMNTYILRHYFEKESAEERRKLIGSIFYFILALNFGLLALQLAVLPSAIDAFGVNVPFYPYFLIAIVNNFFDVISIVPLAVFRARTEAIKVLWISLSRTLLQFGLVVLLVVGFDQGLEGSYYGRLIANIPFVFVYLRFITAHGHFGIDKSIIKDALYFSLPLLPGGLSYLLVSISDRILLERYISLSDLGVYSVAFTFALALQIVIQALYKTFEPVLFKELRNPEFSQINSRLFRVYLLLLVAFGYTGAIFANEVFTVMASPEFHYGYSLVPFMMVSVVLSGLNTYSDVLLIAEKKQKVILWSALLSASVSIGLNLILIPLIGFYGSIVASICSFFSTYVVYYFNTTIPSRRIVLQVILLVGVAVVPTLFDQYLLTNNLILDIALKGVFLIIFAFALFKVLDIKGISPSILQTRRP